MNAVVLRLRVAENGEVGQTRNVLLCRAIARIGEVPQAEGFG